MTTSLKINTTVDVDDRIQSLLVRQASIRAQDADIEAQLASLIPSSAPPSFQHNRSPIHKRRNNVPRSMSNGGSTMARHLSSDRTHHDTSRRSRTLSQQSAPSMARTNSKGASSTRSGHLPFTSNGTMPPPIYSSEPRQANPVVEAWVGQDQPLSAYTFAHQTPVLQRSPSQRKPDLEQVPELDNIGENPGDFLYRTGAPLLSLTPSPIANPTGTMTSQNRHGLSISSRQSQTFGIQTPSTPTTDSLTNATTLASNMSRQNSLSQDAVLGGFQMMKFNSNTSHLTDKKVNDDITYHHVPHYSSSQSSRSLCEEQSLLLVGAGGASHESQFSHSFRTAEPMAQFPSSGSFVEEMQRTQSNESNSSSSSQSRNKQRLQMQNQQAATRPLMPKAGSDDNTMSRENSSQSMTRLESNGSQDKAAIPKTTYQRPKHDPVFCKQCDEHPDGFRGEHELRRHHNRQHKALVKKWVCVEPVHGHNHPKPVYPLSKCKSCSQTKKYGAYYNAAAHLRRAHFKPKVRCRSKGSKIEEKSEKRGGNGGGDWPPMTELKHWMREVEEPAADYPVSQQEDDESEDEYYEHALEEHLSAAAANSTNVPMAGSNFDTPFLSETSILDIFPTPVAQFGSQSMQLDLPLQQNIDSSMSYDSSQTGFDSFPVLPNDTLAFPDNSSFPQTYDDHSFGLDFVNLAYL